VPWILVFCNDTYCNPNVEATAARDVSLQPLCFTVKKQLRMNITEAGDD